MLTILDCIVERHNLWLVVAAVSICTLSVGATLLSFNRAMAFVGRRREIWVAAAGAFGGTGLWATHFVAMLAYSPELPIRYDLPGTALSLLIGVAGVALGLSVAGRRRPAVGGAVTGGAVVALHYCGMLAIRTAGDLQWSPAYIVASVVAGVGLSAMAFVVRNRVEGLPGQVAGGALLVVAVAALHFTGMTALHLVPDLSVRLEPEEISRPALAIGVCLIVAGVLVAACCLILLEARSKRAGLNALQSAFQGVPSNVALYDANGRLVLWNEAFETFMGSMGASLYRGLKRETLMRATVTHLKAGREGRIDYEDAIDSPNAPWEGELPDGRWLKAERRSLPDGSLISVLTDTTDQHRWATAMQDARDRAEAANRAKSEFLANMSHEIRTPLNGVLGMVQVMERDALETRQRERLEVAHQSAKALMVILNDILDHAKIEASQIALDLGRFETSELAASVCAAFSGAAKIKGLSLTWQVEPSATGWWLGDVGKLRQILSNLIGNALKFTSEGGADLTVTAQDGALIFRVKDTGIGVEQAQAETLFEQFAQANGSSNRKFGGMGLGLSICRGLVEFMGGAIRMESRPGEGACVSVSLPLVRDETNPVEAPAAVAVVADVLEDNERPLSILIAEDNPVNRIVVRSLLEPLGADVTMAEDGREAIAAFEAGYFDIILMDIQMPEVNGIEATRAIRALEASRNLMPTPIVAVTANILAEQIQAYTAAGFDAHVPKPIEVETLYSVISTLLSPDIAAAA